MINMLPEDYIKFLQKLPQDTNIQVYTVEDHHSGKIQVNCYFSYYQKKQPEMNIEAIEKMLEEIARRGYDFKR